MKKWIQIMKDLPALIAMIILSFAFVVIVYVVILWKVIQHFALAAIEKLEKLSPRSRKIKKSTIYQKALKEELQKINDIQSRGKSSSPKIQLANADVEKDQIKSITKQDE